MSNGTCKVILDAFESFKSLPASPSLERPELILLSANTEKSLQTSIAQYEDFITKSSKISLSDLAYTLSFRRERLAHRAFALAQDRSIIETWVSAKSPSASPQVYMVFTGQGANWPGMGRELIEKDELFRSDIGLMDAILCQLAHPPSWSMTGKITT